MCVDVCGGLYSTATILVSVGNYDPNIRLGKTHNEMFGAPWGDKTHYVSERSDIMICYDTRSPVKQVHMS